MAKIVVVLSSSDTFKKYRDLIAEIVAKSKYSVTLFNAQKREPNSVLSEIAIEFINPQTNVLLIEEKYAKSMSLKGGASILFARDYLFLSKELTWDKIESSIIYLATH